MEMIRVPRTEIAEETFCIDTDDDFIYMVEKLLGDEAGRYLKKLAEDSYKASYTADEYYEEILRYEKEFKEYEEEIESLSSSIAELQDEIEKNQRTHSCFVFVKE